MKKSDIWNFWAGKYDKLWVQKYSLTPTRNYIIKVVSEIYEKYNSNYNEKIKILDLGSGPGELIGEISDKFKNVEITGVDFSEKMLEISKKRNPKAKHIKMDVAELQNLKDKYNIIICTHSFPYYKEPEKVMKELFRLLEDDGIIYIGFASGDNLYDKFALGFVKITTGSANYPSDQNFRRLSQPYFKVEKLKIIKEKYFMPRIAIYSLKKVRV
ncbi:ubiquinone/menaquinone biosynthesis C-methylase UbiE [Sedimentibacter acidaminivorans]|uniref:Ubiquinone/menaquinone biosynthesis C-methylase UbiE n=1 Tax=Sedimentibacter acidaminivorans TaxID=913099 RepID=A0ABS4GE89_9FIRM|nr:class I SAM-dependent methyltransferase [Sedimentibacter acidaminivorans]MBP1926018.1 ubiquinone/menaquinone biosynthesis C-methylase UbiE [Sedimentibacter acidaminivorans]